MAPCPQHLVALDLEGVLTPEIWPSVGEVLGLPGLGRTTRDTADYAALLAERLTVVTEAGLTFADVLGAVDRLQPLPGATTFLRHLRDRWPVAVLSDTFEQLAAPLLAQLGHPFTLCHRLDLADGRIVGADLRAPDAKQQAVVAFQQLGYRVIAAGDSHNDLAMLRRADHGCLLRPPPALREVGLPVVDDLDGLLGWIRSAAADRAPDDPPQAQGQHGRPDRDDAGHPPAEAHRLDDVGRPRRRTRAEQPPVFHPVVVAVDPAEGDPQRGGEGRLDHPAVG